MSTYNHSAMRKILLLLCTAIATSHFIDAQVAINTDGTTPNSSAMLDIKSTSKGLLTPRMTTAQRNSIVSPATGLMVYDTDVNKFFFYAIGSWIEMGTGSATNYWTLNGSNINNNNAGNVGIGTNTPAVLLHLNGNTDELLRLQGLNPYISFSNNGTVKGYMQSYNDDILLGTIIGNTNGAVRFYNNNVNNMSILANGNVGIGTTTPTSPLSFPNTLGNKISFWNNDATHDFGIGIASGAMRLYTAGQDKISFGWGNSGSFSESATLFTGNGFLGLNTTNPQAQLHINRDAEAMRVSGTGSYISFYNGVTYNGYLWNKGTNDIELATAVGNTTGNLSLGVQGNPHLTIQSDGRVRVGNIACTIPVSSSFSPSVPPKFSIFGHLGIKKAYGDQIGEWAIGYGGYFGVNELGFYYNGGFKAVIDDIDGDWVPSSDIRLKENFEHYKSVLPGIKKLDVLTYHYIADKTGKRSFGLVAQNLKQYFPELVSGSEENGNYLGISYAKTGVLAIKAIQEQHVIIEEQQKRIETLEKRLAVLESKLR